MSEDGNEDQNKGAQLPGLHRDIASDEDSIFMNGKID